MTRIDKADFRTTCNKRLRLIIALTEERLQMSLAPRFLNEDVPQMVERSLCMREVRRTMPSFSNFPEEPGNNKKNTGSYFVRPKKRHWYVRPICKRRIWTSTELAEKAISAPNTQRLAQKDVKGNITLLISESETTLWHKQLLWTPPARHVNRKGKRLACEKHMDWWLASTKPILRRHAIQNSVQLLHWQRKGLIWH